ncbi:UNVERIFIED_CONTAM: hypothetical protein RMT77_007629 [Armadillidium vulgare]
MEKYLNAMRNKDENIRNYATRLNKLARLACMDVKHHMFEMKKLKFLDALNLESAPSIKYTALSEPGITVERIIELASNVEMCLGEKTRKRS